MPLGPHPQPAHPPWSRFAPAALCEALAQAEMQGRIQGENGASLDTGSSRFEAAVMMADISGYSALASRLAEQGPGGAERLSQWLNLSFGLMLDEVLAHGGAVERFVGDALLASFRADGDALAGAVQRAHRCAQTIARRLDGSRAGDVALGVHVGVAVGALQAQHVPLDGDDRAFVLTGQALVEAAAAAVAAPRGQVRLAPAAARLQAGDNTTVPVPSVPALPPEPLAAERLVPYINRALRERLLAATEDTGWLAELRRVTAVFVSPQTAQPDGPVLTLLAQVLGRAAQRFGGHLQELVLDDKGLVGVLLFGLRRTHEDQARRALLAAQAVQAELAAAGLQAGVGVASGSAYTGIVGDERRSELAVVGEPMNRAARLMQAACPGVLCDAATAQDASARQAFGFTAVPGLSLKGMPAEMLAQRPQPRAGLYHGPAQDLQRDLQPGPGSAATAARTGAQAGAQAGAPIGAPTGPPTGAPSGDPTAAQPAPGPAALQPPLGRESEWQQVLAALQPVAGAAAPSPTAPLSAAADGAQRTATALLLEGEPGIGKTALMDAAARQALGSGAALLRLQGQALEQVSAYHAWRAAVAQLLGIDLAADAGSQRLRLQVALSAEPAPADIAALLAAVLPHAGAATPAVEAMDAQTRAERLREWLLQCVARAAAAVPLVLLVEDAHWLDSASWALLQGMAARRLPVCVLASSRPLKDEARTALQAWLDAAGASVLPIGPLSRAAAAELVRRKLGVATLTDGVEQLVHTRAAGHPFFTEELVLALRDGGALRIDGGVCTLAVSGGQADPLLVPDTLGRALTARIDGIGEAERLSLKVASVLGRDFSQAQLAAAHPLPGERPRLPLHLQALVAHELLQADGSGRYRFKHAITRDVAYGLLPFAQRRDLHRVVAEQLQQQAGDADPQRAALLAHHWSNAEVADQALAACEQAGEQAMDRFAHREAVHFLRQAQHWNTVQGRTVPGQRVAHWLSQMGLAHRLMGELDASRQALEDALRELRVPVPSRRPGARAALLWALLQFALGRPRVAPPGTPRNADNTAVEAYAQLTMLAYYNNDVERMVACSLLAARAAQRAAPGRELAALHGSLAHTASFFRLGTAMQRAIAAAGQVAQHDPQPLVLGTACQYTGHLAACRGDFARYAADMQRAHEAYRPLGRCRPLDEAETNLACLYTHLGRLDEALAMSLLLEQSGRARDDLQSTGWGVIGQARVLFARGQLDRALDRLEACDGLLVDLLTRVEAMAMRALVQQRSGRPREALAAAMQAVQWLEEAPSNSYFSLSPYGHLMETLVLLAADVAADAEQRAAAHRAAPRMLKAFARYAALMPVAAVQHRIWTGAVAQLRGRHRAALRAWRRARLLAEHSQVPLDLPMAQRWLARAASGAERLGLLQQATDGFAALGRRFEAEDARQALHRAVDAPEAAEPDGRAPA
jgi:class 3 adenylate cyclase/tetratricopeptide (TPR) repeat protein